MIKRILLSVSQNPEQAAEITIAIDLATRHDAEITGFTAVDPEIISLEVPKPLLFTQSYANQVDDLVKQSQDSADKALETIGKICAEQNVTFIPAAASSSECETMTEACRFQDLCILPTQLWEPGVEGLLSSDAILHLVTAGLRPLIAVPNAASITPPSKALVALSGSLESAKALKQFTQLQLYSKIPVHLVTIGDPKSDETAQELIDQATTYLKAHGNPVTSACLQDTDDRVAALLSEAEKEGAGIFVIGSSYKKLVAMKRFGKHALGLIEQSKLPIFISH